MNKFQIDHNYHYAFKREGFKITFTNGYTVSVQFGSGTYSDEGETTAEVAAWGPGEQGEYVKLTDYDDVKAHCSPEEVLEVMNKVAAL
jgi:hypothetical protein